MNQNTEPNFTNDEQNVQYESAPVFGDKPKENVIAGIVGAFLFSLAGGILWFVLYQVGFLAGISGAVAVICAIKGYSFFSKGESMKGIIISVVISLLVIVIAWYTCLSYDVYLVHGEWFAAGEIDYEITFFDALRGAYVYLSESEIAAGYFTDLLIGIVLCVITCVGTVRNELAKVKAKQQQQF